MSKTTRHDLVQAVRSRYAQGSRAEKKLILNEFSMITGYHRKHAIRLLSNKPVSTAKSSRPRGRLYDQSVVAALIILWEASDRICGKRLKAAAPLLLAALERQKHLRLSDETRAKLLQMSPATMDRMLAQTRAPSAVGRKRAVVPSALQRRIPIRTFGDWNDPPPGFVEIDLVAHCGGILAGSFVHTMSLTDIASGWTECIALVVREGTLVVEALAQLCVHLPFQLRGIDSDNGSEFINEALAQFCVDHGITQTRSRPYRKNDQAWIEQKNGSVVRKLVGYDRIEGLAGARLLAQLYAASRLFVNFFQPSFKLASKTRVGARVTKRYHPPETPCARLLKHSALAEEQKQRLRAVAATLDPLRLLDAIRAMQEELAAMATGEATRVSRIDLKEFIRSLETLWQRGEVRATHRARPPVARDWRTRKDPLEASWPKVRAWLEAEPDRTAKELLGRLRERHPDEVNDAVLRTLQRRVREWRATAARATLFASLSSAGIQSPDGKNPLPSVFERDKIVDLRTAVSPLG